MLFALLSILEAGSLSDMPLIIQIIVFCHLQKSSVLLEHCLSELCAPLVESRWDVRQMCPGAARQPTKKKEKQREKGRRWRHTTAWQSRPRRCRAADLAILWDKESRQIAHVLVYLNATTAQSYWWISMLTCLFAQLLLWVTVSPSSNCTAIELGNSDRMTIRQAKLHQADNVMKKNR